MIENLVIVESPAKARTIEKFLGKDYVVKSSFGHVRDLAKKNLGIDIENDFNPDYIISADKKKVVKELKDLSKKANTVWIASDEDREGEAIAWHLQEVLGLDHAKTKRIVFHEITKDAIQRAIENPRNIDINLVNAQQARRILDRLVGFELSPLLWKKVKPSLSAGRVQSVAVKLIVEREREINAFTPKSYFRVLARFVKEGDSVTGQELKADLSKRFDTIGETREFLEKCKPATFTVGSVEKKPGKKSPSPPFTTSTLQQEASRKLGYSVSQTMAIAQRLYESGLITYMRTDSVNLSSMAISTASAEIKSSFGEKYLKVRKYATKSKGAQEAHEAIRPTYISNRTIEGGNQEKRLYELIWKRTIASQMSDAQLERTTIKIDISTAVEHFVATGEVLFFDGFLKVYMESFDDEHDEETGSLLPPMKQNDMLTYKIMEAVQKFTTPAARYTEASLVKKMEELGIGRPSTYAPTITTIQNRNYVIKETREGQKREITSLVLKNGNIEQKELSENFGQEKQKLFPTDIGIVVNDFLEQYFVEIMNYNFTADVEKEFDSIALGEAEWTEMISKFYDPFHKKVDETMQTSEKSKGERILGTDPDSGKPVSVKIGRFGPMVQIGDVEDEEKPRFASLLKGQSMESLTMEEAMDLFKLPRTLGQFEDADVTAAIGRFGPYIRHQNKFVSLGKEDDPHTVTLDHAIELIRKKREEEKNRIIKEFDDKPGLQVLNGRYGPYIAYNKKNYKIPKSKKPDELTLEECLEIIEKAPDKPARRRKK
ncbi:MAG: type I DNA topoisomerase [Bacteroidales bacterium]